MLGWCCSCSPGTACRAHSSALQLPWEGSPGIDVSWQLGSAPLLLMLLNITECHKDGGTRPGLSIMEDRDLIASLGSCGILPHAQAEKGFLISIEFPLMQLALGACHGFTVHLLKEPDSLSYNST